MRTISSILKIFTHRSQTPVADRYPTSSTRVAREDRPNATGRAKMSSALTRLAARADQEGGRAARLHTVSTSATLFQLAALLRDEAVSRNPSIDTLEQAEAILTLTTLQLDRLERDMLWATITQLGKGVHEPDENDGKTP